MNHDNPFAVLGIAPTLSAAHVREAWHAAVRDHPPHRDAEAFRRVRDAYEALRQPDALQQAWLTAPFDAAAVLAALEVIDASARAVAVADVKAARGLGPSPWRAGASGWRAAAAQGREAAAVKPTALVGRASTSPSFLH